MRGITRRQCRYLAASLNCTVHHDGTNGYCWVEFPDDCPAADLITDPTAADWDGIMGILTDYVTLLGLNTVPDPHGLVSATLTDLTVTNRAVLADYLTDIDRPELATLVRAK